MIVLSENKRGGFPPLMLIPFLERDVFVSCSNSRLGGTTATCLTTAGLRRQVNQVRRSDLGVGLLRFALSYIFVGNAALDIDLVTLVKDLLSDLAQLSP